MQKVNRHSFYKVFTLNRNMWDPENVYGNVRIKMKRHIKKVINLGREMMRLLGPNKGLFLEYEVLVGLIEKEYVDNVYELSLHKSMPTTLPTKAFR